MADFTKRTAADMAMNNPGVNMGTTGSMQEVDWGAHDQHWQQHYASRPYVKADRGYEHYRPAYRYGAEARLRHAGRDWTDVEPELERDWAAHPHSARSPWQEAKDAVREAWERIRH